MIKTITIAINLLLILKVSNLCNDGCIQCSTDDECLTCDSTKNYFLINGSCIQKSIPKCTLTSLEATCLLCDEKYYVDSNTGSCVAVPSENLIPNCKNYVNRFICHSCAPDFFLQNSNCTAIQTKIENCSVYSSEVTCSECASGYTLAFDKMLCAKNPSLNNCQLFSKVTCDSCTNNSLPEPNSYLYQLINMTQDTAFNKRADVIKKLTKTDLDVTDKCTAIKAANCARYKSFKQCADCASGYYTNEKGICTPNPTELIDNCLIYKSAIACQTCIQGYYLKTSSQCAEVEDINNCELYSPTADEVICTKCFDNFYLASFNLCDNRSIQIQYCLTYNSKADKCDICFQDYALTSDGLKCLPAVSNCRLYSSSSQNSTQMRCTSCVDGYYVNSNICLQGTQQNCKIYETARDRCAQCDNKYYLTAEKACFPHEDIADCLGYDPVTKNRCLQCLNDSVPFKKSTDCIKHSVTGCNIYITNTTCGECQDGYDLNNKNLCDPIPLNSHCLRSVVGICTKCKSNYILSNGSCFEHFQYDTAYCKASNINGSLDFTDAQCRRCADFAYPYDYKDNYGCVQYKVLEYIMKKPIVEDCLSYSTDNSGNFICAKCDKGMMLQNNSCVQNCLSSEYIRRYELKFDVYYDAEEGIEPLFVINKSDACETIDGYCKIYYPGYTHDTGLNKYCAKCDSAAVQVVNVTENQQIFVWGKDTLEQKNSNTLQSILNVLCILPTSLTLFGADLNSIRNNCATYTVLPSGEHGCLKCKNGYFGREVDYRVLNCKIYDENTKTCIECLNQYSLKDGYHCVLSPNIANCSRYSTTTALDVCVRCNDGYYLHSNRKSCIARQMTDCAIPDVAADLCVICDNGKSLNSARDRCFDPIEYCSIHQLVTKNGNILCQKCNDGHALNADNDICTDMGNPDCVEYNVSDTPTCILYKDKSPFWAYNKCVNAERPDNCITVVDVGVCNVCDNDTYLNNGKCCPVNQYHNGTSCVNIPVDENCANYETDSSSVCAICVEDYYLVQKSANKCCHNETYFYDGDCLSNLDLSINQKHCNVFNIDEYRCISCEDGAYMQNGTCCEEGKYFDKITRTCSDILENTNCLQVSLIDFNYCIKCESPQVPTNGHCCDDGKYWSTECKPLDESCSSYNDINGCLKCANGYYKTNDINVCCEFGGYYNYEAKSCQDIEDDFGIAHCIKFDQRLGRCTEAEDGFVLFEEDTVMCEENHGWTGSICLITSNLYRHCRRVDIDNYCEECVSGYYLSYGFCLKEKEEYYDFNDKQISPITIDNCNQQDKLNCISCNNGSKNLIFDGNLTCCQTKFKPNDECLDFVDELNRCAVYQLPAFKCLKGISSNEYYSLGGSTLCANNSYEATPYSCESIETSNCKISVDGTACIECENGYYLKDDKTCASLPTNCAFSDKVTECNLCKVGSLKIDNNGTTCQLLGNYVNDNSCDDEERRNLANCATPNASDSCSCDACRPYYYITDGTCCRYGTYLNDGICINMPLEHRYCAVLKENKCEQCFFDKTAGILQDNIKFSYVLFNSDENGNQITTYTPSFKTTDRNFENYYISSDHCCPQGQFFNKNLKTCTPIGIDFCSKFLNGRCVQCKDDYILTSDSKRCCRYNQTYDPSAKLCIDKSHTISCPQGYVLTLNHCCPEKSYWDEKESRCIPLLDDNCIVSSSRTTCDVCINGFEFYAGNKIKYLYSAIEAPYLYLYPDIVYNVAMCTPYENGQHDAVSLSMKNTNCQVFDFNTLECVYCKENYYKTESRPFCVPEGYFATNLGYIDINQPLNCASYDSKSRECLFCNDGYHLHRGVCCENGYFWNNIDGECKEVENCKIYDYDNNTCLMCSNDYYLFNSKCIAEGKYLNNNQQVTSTENGLTNCLQFIDATSCRICDDSTYLFKNKCCPPNKYYDNGDCINIPSATYGACAYLNDDLQCKACKSGSYLYAGFCCAKGSIYSAGSCVSFDIYSSGKYRGCDYVEHDNCHLASNCDNENICTPDLTCADGEYISNGQCCPLGTHYSFEGEGACVIIKPYAISNCTSIHSNICTSCKEYYHLYPQSNICCPYGTYVDPITLECIKGTVSNCKSYDYQDSNESFFCKECIDGYIRYAFYSDKLFSEVERVECAINVADYANYSVPQCLNFFISLVNDNYACTSCKDPYQVTGKGCCPENMFYSSTKKDCYSPNRCGVFNSASNTCTQCSSPASGEYISGPNKYSCCLPGFYFKEETNSCTLITITNCSKTIDNKKCIECKSGFVLKRNGLCGVHEIENCADMAEIINVSDATICLTCNNNYFVTNSGINCEQGTKSAECQILARDTDACLQCNNYNTHYLDESTDTCEFRNIIDSCEVYEETADNCLYCNSSYYLNSSGECSIKDIDGCDKYTIDGDCDECEDDKLLFEGSCGDNGTINNCLKYNNDDNSCVLCEPEYYLDNNTCNRYSFKLEGCLLYDHAQTDASCKLCDSEYILSTDVTNAPSALITVINYCIPKIQHCKSYKMVNDNISCDTCEDNFILYGFHCKQQSVIPNCETLSAHGQFCLECNQGYMTTFRNCLLIPFVEGCTQYDKYGVCIQCGPYYEHDEDTDICEHKPEINGCEIYSSDEYKCLKCLKGHYVSNDGSTCTFITLVKHCTKYSHNNDECLECDHQNYINDGLCAKREIEIDNCQTYKNDAETCSECMDGYYLSAPIICSKRTINSRCASYSPTADQCLTCDKSYYYHENECKSYSFANIYKCRVKSPTANACSICVDDYYVSSGICVVRTPITGCTEYTKDADTCEVCKAEYILNNGACVSLPLAVNCKTYDSAADECIVCNDGYFLKSGRCYVKVIIPNCDKQDALTNECVKCSCNPSASCYQLQHGICILRTATIAYCVEYIRGDDVFDEDRCEKCQNSYYLTYFEFADPRYKKYCENTHCATFSDEGICTACNEGYQLHDDYPTCIKNPRLVAFNEILTHTMIETDLQDANTRISCSSFAYQISSTNYQCIICDDKQSAPDGAECTKLTVLNCDIYDQENSKCAVCKATFHLVDDGTNPPTCEANTTGPFISTTGQVAEDNYLCFNATIYGNGCTSSSALSECDNINVVTGSCVKCTDVDHYFNGTACVPNDVSNCTNTDSSYNTTSNYCIKCENTYYPSSGICCLYGTYSYIFDDSESNPSSCIPIENEIDINCVGIDRDNCTECLFGYAHSYTAIKVGNPVETSKCCNYGEYVYNGVCTSIETTGLATCAILANENICIECESGYNLTFDHCCEEGYYYDADLRNCIIIEDLGIHNCKKVNTNYFTCDECNSSINDAYITNNSCCENGTYWNGSDCVDTSTLIPNCNKITGGQCLECSVTLNAVNNNLVAHDGICCQNIFGTGHHYDYEAGKCVSNPLNCSDYDYFNDICLSCKGYVDEDDNNVAPEPPLYAGPGACCPEGEYYNGTSCVAISTLAEPDYKDKCLRLNSIDTSLCLKCVSGYSAIANHCVAAALFVNDCKALSDDGNCTSCDVGYVSNGVCCPSGEYFDFNTSVDECTELTDNCIQNTKGVCTACLDGKPLSNNNICCNAGIDSVTTDCYEGTAIDNCELYSEEVCDKCAKDYILQKDGEICCPENHRYDIEYEKCLPLPLYNANCMLFDKNAFECVVCTAGHNKSDKFCTLDGDFFDSSNSPTYYSEIDAGLNCEIYSELKKCVKCSSNGVTRYVSGGLCCTEGTYNDDGSCVDIPNIDELDNCLQYENELCTKCGSTTPNIYFGKCCSDGNFYDTESETCIKTIDNCLIYDISDADNIICKTCVDDFILSEEGKFCCEVHSYAFFNEINTCDTAPVTTLYKNCKEYDADNIRCLQCNPGTYLNYGYCCLDGEYHDKSNNTCKSIANDYPYPERVHNCINIDPETNNCIVCAATYKVDNGICCYNINTTRQQEYNGICYDNPDKCFNYDRVKALCTECYPGYYISTSNRCVQIGRLFDGTKIVEIGNKYPNCTQVENLSCKQCENNYYLDRNTCCPHGKYYDNNKGCLDGDVLYCNKYAGTKGSCLECAKGYYIVNINGRKYCHPIDYEHCADAQISQSDKNYIQCNECEANNIDYILQDLDKMIYINFQHDEIDYDNCNYFNIKNLLNSTDFSCLRCTDNDIEYVNNNNCETRTATNCHGEKPFNSDTCNACEPGYYLDVDNLCKAGVNNCKIETLSNSCMACLDNYIVLDENGTRRCLSINTETEFLPNFYPAYVDRCIDHTSCSTTVYTGLSAEVNSIYSCHACTDSTKIPFIGIRGEEAADNLEFFGLQQYTLTNVNNPDVAADRYSSECLPLSTISAVALGTFNFPPNCALGAINSNVPLSALQSNQATHTTDNTGVRCTACKPGYRPGALSSNLFVYQCTQIGNCNKPGNRANGCELCDSGYLPYQNDTGLNYGYCVQSNDSNCFAVDNTNFNLAKCAVCKKGYSINKDGICEILKSGFCESFELFKSFSWFQYESNILLAKNNGCSKCQEGYKGFNRADHHLVCTYSSYLESGSFVQSSLYTSNCLKYDFDHNSTKCVECNAGFVVSLTGECIAITNKLTNCVIAVSAEQCGECTSDYVVISGVCVAKNIEKCVEYVNNPSPIIITCSKCDYKYYLFNNICYEGQIQDCEIYKSATICEKCSTGYAKAITRNNVEVCFPVTTHPNCAVFDAAEFQQNNIVCQSCSSNDYFVGTIATQNNYVCNNVRTVDYCVLYDNTARHLTSTYKCVQCVDGYYVSDNKCVLRGQEIPNCKEYHANKHQCAVCNTGFFIDQTGLNCQPNPKGIPGCLHYSDFTTCKRCGVNLYLLDNECLSVPSKQLISNCRYYLDSASCSECVAGYLVDKGTCKKILAQNCLVYDTYDSCASCPINFGLVRENGILNCIEKPTLINCLKVTDQTPFKCEQCTANHYLNDTDVCTIIITKIEKCELYSTATQCSKCNRGYVLSANRTKCIFYKDNTFCDNFIEREQPFCALCKPGYKLNDTGACEVIDPNTELIAKCLIPNYFEDNTCLVCNSGYIQNKIGDCVGGLDDGAYDGVSKLGVTCLLVILLSYLNLY